MIRYALQCTDAGCAATGEQFEGWFSNSGDFDEQKKKGLLKCPCCEGTHVEKALMAPAVSNGLVRAQERRAAQEIADYRQHIEERALNVGTHFAEKAFELHNPDQKIAEKARRRMGDKDYLIGTPTGDEVASLLKEGIPLLNLPEVPDTKKPAPKRANKSYN